MASPVTKEVADTAVARVATAARADTVVATAVSLVVTAAKAVTRRAASEVKVIIKLNPNYLALPLFAELYIHL